MGVRLRINFKKIVVHPCVMGLNALYSTVRSNVVYWSIIFAGNKRVVLTISISGIRYLHKPPRRTRRLGYAGP